MGLTGVIIEARLRLETISSVSITTEANATANLKESLTLLNEHNEKKYVVAWVDCLARGAALGRGIIHCGHHSNAGKLQHRESSSIGVPFTTPGFLLNRATMATFNSLYFKRHSRAAGARQQHYDSFFFPLDSIRNWNRLYGSRGFLQYQFVVPDESAERCLTEILGAVSSAGKGSFLAVLKRFGAANQNLLSFPRAGLTLTLDFKFEPSLLSLLDELDAMVLAHGGRIYLAKDARMSEAVFKQGYPNWEAFKAIKDRVDPDGLFASMQSNRLGLSGADMGSSTA
jgi:FAD/FMN-containing dehydrogenase